MTQITRIAFIGNSLPRHCGIATFTTDLRRAVADFNPNIETCIIAMTDPGREYHYPPEVRFQIREDRVEDYIEAADILNAGRFDAVSLQHEFGIFGGEAGVLILALLSRLTMPIVTTLHTVLSAPSAAQRSVLQRIIALSSKIVVMAEKGREILQAVYHVPDDRIDVIPHGIPEFAFVKPDAAKEKLGFGGKPVILTFGLLSPNKGIEVVIDAMPAILSRRPDAIYVVLGASHPNLVRREGEKYRESLVARTHSLGIEDHVVFLDRFVDHETLLEFISMCDVYVTPYLDEAQMTSGTLAYSFGLGKPVVSTPYWHAQELLANGRGMLVPFGDVATTADAIAFLLIDDKARQAMGEQAYAISRSMTWPRAAARYQNMFHDARRSQRLSTLTRQRGMVGPRDRTFPSLIALPGASPTLAHKIAASARPTPEMRTSHLRSMCDDVGLFQHAVHRVPDRLHGYCVDDNARALLVACALGGKREECLAEALTDRFSAFVQHAWNTDTKRFRNFMSFDRRWLEPSGSEDSHGRTLWALGECARSDWNVSRRRWATALFAEASTTVESFRSPRAWAFTLLGLEAYSAVAPEDAQARELQTILAGRLSSLLSIVATDDWVWFEDGLAYDNARLPQALITTGLSMGVHAHVDAGIKALRWLVKVQTTAEGHFRPVGSQSFGDKRSSPRPFDQQPLEATATISACLAAWRATDEILWKAEAMRAFGWFLGDNDLAISLVDLDTGSCRDGLHPDRANENRGGESAVSYLLSLAEIRELARADGDAPKLPVLHAVKA